MSTRHEARALLAYCDMNNETKRLEVELLSTMITLQEMDPNAPMRVILLFKRAFGLEIPAPQLNRCS